jgi:hypothetical protein
MTSRNIDTPRQIFIPMVRMPKFNIISRLKKPPILLKWADNDDQKCFARGNSSTVDLKLQVMPFIIAP